MTATARTATTATRTPARLGVALATLGLVAAASACGADGTSVFERKSNSSTSGVAVLQPGTYQLSVSCTDKRSSRKVNGKTRKSGATPTVSLSTVINGQQVETDANCSGSDSEKFTVATVSELRFDATLNGSATYTAKVLLQQ